MVKYLNAELFKVRHRVYLFGFLAVVLGGISAMFMMLKANANPGTTAESILWVLPLALSVGLYLVVAISDMVFSDQYKYNTLKNEVSYGLPRFRIYFGKLIATAIMCVVLCAVILAYYFLLTVALFPQEGTMPEMLKMLGEMLLQALPLWLGGLGLYQALLFLVRGSTAATVIYVLVVGALDSVLKLLGMLMPALEGTIQKILTCLLQTNFAATGGGIDLPHAWLVGMAWLLIATLMGAVVFQKREIN